METNERRPRLFAPGPMNVPERIRNAMALPVLHHPSREFQNLIAEVRERLARLFNAPGWDPLVFTCSGTGAMECAVVNIMKRGAKAINVSAGKFGERWAHIARAYGCEVVEIHLDW